MIKPRTPQMATIPDLPPLRALVMTLGKLKDARTDGERSEILRVVRILRERYTTGISLEPDEPSPPEQGKTKSAAKLAKKIQALCGGMTLDTTAIALSLKYRNGGHIRQAVKSLLESGEAKKAGKGLYRIKKYQEENVARQNDTSEED